jgi:AcrR family transcriptional regulator
MVRMATDVSSKQKILDVATKLFSTQGLKNTNIRQIATEAKTNSALIFYYFGCKEKLFFECLTELASERFKVAGEILTPPADLRDFEVKISLFIQNMFEVFQTKRDLIKILHKEIDNENKLAIKVFETHFVPVSVHLQNFLGQAQKKKIIAKDIDVKALTFDFFGMISNPLRNEVILKTIFKNEIAKNGIAGFYKAAHSRLLNLFLKGVLADENQ